MNPMEIKAIVKYRDHYAEYRISEESKGIYNAVLERYTGSVHDRPPSSVIITMGIRRWIGSTFNQPLIDSLGEVIEVNVQSNTFFRSKDKDETAIENE